MRHFWMRSRCIAVLVLAFATPAAAQTPALQAQPEQVEQALGIDFRQVFCTLGGVAIEAVTGPQSAATVTAMARSAGLCPAASAPTGGTAPFPAQAGVDAAKPGLQFKILKVSGTGAQTTVTAATPDTQYAQNEGVILFMAYNAPGYLQIWSIDDTSETLLEGVLLSGSTASALTLPEKARNGFYRFTTSGGMDTLRLRFLPCRHSSNQALEFTSNAYVATQVAAQTPSAVVSMTSSLPTCPFPSGTFNPAAENDGLFRRPQVQLAPVNASTGAQAAVLTTGGADNATSLVVDVRLLRR